MRNSAYFPLTTLAKFRSVIAEAVNGKPLSSHFVYHPQKSVTEWTWKRHKYLPVYTRVHKMSCSTHPLSIQQQVHFEEHAVVDGDILIPVKDLKYAAEYGAVVHPRGAEAAFACCATRRHTLQSAEATLVHWTWQGWAAEMHIESRWMCGDNLNW